MNATMIPPEIRDGLQWLEQTALAEAVRSGTWTYAALESLHLVALGLLFGSIAALDARLIGLSRGLAADKTARHLLPFAGIGFAMAAASGFVMFMADAVALASNPAFLLKLGIIALAAVNAAAFHFGPFRSIGTWNEGRRPPAAAIAMGACSLVLWSAVIVCGRLIAYV